MPATLTNLKAEAAMRHEDWRVAKKHRAEAEDRWADNPTEANHAAALGAQRWANECHARYLDALDAWNAVAEGAAA